MKDKGVVAIIQSRLGSTRLPGKVLLDLAGKTVLERVIERVRAAKKVNLVVVATTTLKDDEKIANLCQRTNVKFYRGSEKDVLDRYYQTAKKFLAQHIVRITADCPLIDYKIIDKVIEKHLGTQSDYTSNTLEETYPDGEDVEVFTIKSLTAAWEKARLASEREHVTPYIKKHPEIFKLTNVKSEINLSDKRWTLDEPRDYKFIRIIYANLIHYGPLFGLEEILEFINKHPDIEQINRGITRNEGYLKSLRKDRVLQEKTDG